MCIYTKLDSLKTGNEAEQKVAKIIDDILGRSGIGNELESIDSDIIDEMISGWVEIVSE